MAGWTKRESLGIGSNPFALGKARIFWNCSWGSPTSMPKTTSFTALKLLHCPCRIKYFKIEFLPFHSLLYFLWLMDAFPVQPTDFFDFFHTEAFFYSTHIDVALNEKKNLFKSDPAQIAFFQGASSLRRSEGGPRPNRLWTSSAQELRRDDLDHTCIQPPCLHLSLPHTPIQGACVSLGGPGPMHSFSDVCEKLLQTKNITQSVVCAMMWQLASTHMLASPMVCPYLLVICCHHPPTKQTASHQQRGTTLQLLSSRDYTD